VTTYDKAREVLARAAELLDEARCVYFNNRDEDAAKEFAVARDAVSAIAGPALELAEAVDKEPFTTVRLHYALAAFLAALDRALEAARG